MKSRIRIRIKMVCIRNTGPDNTHFCPETNTAEEFVSVTRTWLNKFVKSPIKEKNNMILGRYGISIRQRLKGLLKRSVKSLQVEKPLIKSYNHINIGKLKRSFPTTLWTTFFSASFACRVDGTALQRKEKNWAKEYFPSGYENVK